MRNVFFIQIQCQREIFGPKKSSFSIPVVCNSKKCPSPNTNLSENTENHLRKDKKNWFRADNVENWHCHNAIGWLS